jgi:hypothetical protein
MAEKLSVYFNTTPVITRVLLDVRNEDDPNAAVDITGYDFRFIVKQDMDLPDSEAWFDLAGAIVTAASGIYSFTLTVAHTCQAPGTWPGEIRWWATGYAAGKPPTDRVAIDYEIVDVVDKP